MNLEFAQTHAGAAGIGVAVSAGFAANVVALTPLLQGISLIVSILAGCLSVIWYVLRFWNRK